MKAENQQTYTTNKFTRVNRQESFVHKIATQFYIHKFKYEKNGDQNTPRKQGKNLITNDLYWKTMSYTHWNSQIRDKNVYIRHQHLNKIPKDTGLQIDITVIINHIFTSLDLRIGEFCIYDLETTSATKPNKRTYNLDFNTKSVILISKLAYPPRTLFLSIHRELERISALIDWKSRKPTLLDPPWPISAVFRIRKAKNLIQHIVIQWIEYNKTVYKVRGK